MRAIILFISALNTIIDLSIYLQAIPEKVKQYCHLGDSLVVMSRYKLVLATCVNAGTFYSLSLRRDHFTHVYIDEAGQATEPECLIPIGLGAEGQVLSQPPWPNLV